MFQWRGPAPYFFVPAPTHVNDFLHAHHGELTYGWGGVIPAQVRVGTTVVTTSLIPRDGVYLVPLKVALRRPEGIDDGDVVRMALQVGHEDDGGSSNGTAMTTFVVDAGGGRRPRHRRGEHSGRAQFDGSDAPPLAGPGSGVWIGAPWRDRRADGSQDPRRHPGACESGSSVTGRWRTTRGDWRPGRTGRTSTGLTTSHSPSCRPMHSSPPTTNWPPQHVDW